MDTTAVTDLIKEYSSVRGGDSISFAGTSRTQREGIHHE